ncbi:MAG: leucine-rich repeat domain-containing protein [Oscillospiraceae bacterium]|nr:leucine-rich repeat domain-containing protein [Oscillospiraceae bacterium]
MKHKLNKNLSALLAVLLCAGLFVFAAPAAHAAELSGTCGESLTWSLRNGTLTISGTGSMTAYTEYSMPPWLSAAGSIQRVVVGQGVTSVSDLAFYECTALTAVTLADSVTSIGELAFAGCTSLNYISMNGVQHLARGVFYDCSALANVVLPAGLHTIGDQAFFSCQSLGGIIVPAGVQIMGDGVFAYCDALVYAEILAPISILPAWTFFGCDSLNQVFLPSTIQAVEPDALVECDDLYHVDYSGSDGVKQMIDYQLSQPSAPSRGPDVDKVVDYSQNTGSTTTTIEKLPAGNGLVTDSNNIGTTVNATVTDPSGWQDVTQTVNNAINGGKQPSVDIQLQGDGDTTLPGGALSDLLDKDVTVTIHTPDADWKLEVDDQDKGILSGEQDLSVQITPGTDDRYTDTIGDSESYSVTLGDTTFNSTLLFPLGGDTAHRIATLYAVDGRELKKVGSVIVDNDGKAAFSLAGTRAGEYVLALDVPNEDPMDAVIPEVLAPEYDITYGATLTDAYGNQYVLTGRVNKLGISAGTLGLIVLGVLLASTLLVGAVMVMWNKARRRRFTPPSR